MALIRFGGGVTEMRGSIAGTTFSRTRGGAIARARTVPVNPNTLIQADNRSLFAMVVAAWNSIDSKGVIDGWNSWASEVELVNRLGEAYTPSGRQMYLSVNMAKVTSGQPMLTTAPIETVAPSPDAGITNVVAQYASGTPETLTNFSTNVLEAQVGTSVYFDATPPLLPSKTNVENLYRRITTFEPAASAQNMIANYLAVFPEANGSSESLAGKIIRWRYRVTEQEKPMLSAYVYGSSTIVED